MKTPCIIECASELRPIDRGEGGRAAAWSTESGECEKEKFQNKKITSCVDKHIHIKRFKKKTWRTEQHIL